MIRAANRANCWSARVRWRNTRTAIATAAKPALQSCFGVARHARTREGERKKSVRFYVPSFWPVLLEKRRKGPNAR